jgi:hypothetical protein
MLRWSFDLITCFLVHVADREASITKNTTMMEDQYVITETDTILLGAAMLEAAHRATVGQHRISHTYMTATVPLPASTMTRVAEAARQTTGSRQWEQNLIQARQLRRQSPNDLQTSHVL